MTATVSVDSAGTWRPEKRAVTAAEVAERLRGETRVLAVSHEAPDGDALGCLSAFILMTQSLGIECQAFIPGEAAFPAEYMFLPGLEKILRGSPPAVTPGTTMYLLDCASLLRFGSQGIAENAFRVNIDHHQDNLGYGELNMLDPLAASTTALLYDVLKAGDFPIDLQIATALYVGLVTDTGRFQYSNTTPAAHRMAAELQESGVDVSTVYRMVYENTPLPKLLLLQRALCHMEIRLGGAMVVSWLGDEDFNQAGAGDGHAEGLIDILRRVQGVRVAALLREKRSDDRVETKVSLRSTDSRVNVAAVAQLRGGGGHVRAAGFTSGEGVAAVLEWLEQQIEMNL